MPHLIAPHATHHIARMHLPQLSRQAEREDGCERDPEPADRADPVASCCLLWTFAGTSCDGVPRVVAPRVVAPRSHCVTTRHDVTALQI